MKRHVLVTDCETSPRDECRQYVKAAGNLKDEAKKAASIEERSDRLAVDINGARIVVLGWWDTERGDPTTLVCQDEDGERFALGQFWHAWLGVRKASGHSMLTGFCIRTFDLPLYIRRSQLLGVPYPYVSLARYHKGDVFDLFDELTFHEGHYGDGVVPRSLDVFCRQFGIDVDDAITGSDVPALVAKGDLEPVIGHNRADLMRVGLLGQRIGAFDCRTPILA